MISHTYIESYMTCNGYCLMLYRILWPHKFNILHAWYSLQMSYKTPHNFMVMGLGHKCKVALWYKLFSLRTLRNLLMRMLIPSFLIFFFKEKKESWMSALLRRYQLMFWSAQKILFGGLWLLIGSENFPITRVFNYRTYLIKIDSEHLYVQEITLFYPRIRMLKVQGW